MFEQKGVIVLEGEIKEEALLEISLEGGADSYELIDDVDFQDAEVLTEINNLENLDRTFQEAGFTVRDASLRWLPNTTIEVSNPQQMRSRRRFGAARSRFTNDRYFRIPRQCTKCYR